MSSQVWKNVAKGCYFALTGMLALSIALFVVGTTLFGYFLTAAAELVAIAVYAVIQSTDLRTTLVAWTGNNKNSSGELVTGIVTIIVVVVAWVSYTLNSVFMASVFIGGVGGLAHEIAQSNGRIVLPSKDDKTGDWFLGSLFGLFSGGVAGLLLSQGLAQTAVNLGIVAEAFLAGLGLKGVADAVAAPRPDAQKLTN